MSVQAMTWVWNHSRAKNGARLVLLAIADCAAGDGTNAWPSTRELCRKTNLTQRAVQAAIRQCVELGELLVDMNAGREGTNLYTLPMRTAEKSTPPQDLPPADTGTLQNLRDFKKPQVNDETPADPSYPAESAPPQIFPLAHEESAPGTVMNRHGNRHSLVRISDALTMVRTKSGSDDDPDFAAFWEIYPKKKGKGEARRAWVSALKRDAKPDEIIAAAHRFRAEREGEDPQYTPYPATWLNKERYADEPDPAYEPRPAAANTASSSTSVWERAAARFARKEYQ